MFDEFYDPLQGVLFTKKQPWTLFEMPDLNVVVAGLNSTMAEGHDCQPPGKPNEKLPRHVGYVGELQLRWFADCLKNRQNEGWLRIGIVHHNQQRGCVNDEENLQDADRLERIIGPHLNILLHGHAHETRLRRLDHGVPVASTGSAGLKTEARPPEVPNQYQILQISANRLRVLKRCYFSDRDEWGADVRGAKDGLVEESVVFDSVFAALAPAGDEKPVSLLAAYLRGVKHLPMIPDSLNLGHEYRVQPFTVMRIPIAVREASSVRIVTHRRRDARLLLADLVDELIHGTSKVTMLRGEAGIGKTTSCKWLRANLCQQPQGQIIPLYVALGEWQPGKSFNRFLDKQVRRCLDRRVEQSTFWGLRDAAQVAGCRLVLLLDGWNEQQPEALRKVQRFVRTLLDDGTTRVIITSRPVMPADIAGLGEDVRLFELQRWTTKQLLEYFRDHGHSKLLKRLPAHVQDCLRLPLLAFLFLDQLAHEWQAPSVATTAELLNLVLNEYLRSIRQGSRGRTLPALPASVAQGILPLLQKMAFHMTAARILHINVAWLRESTAAVASSNLELTLAHCVNSGLLRYADPSLPRDSLAAIAEGREFRFLHQILQEFLTAQYLLVHSRREPRAGLPPSASTDAFWREVPIYMIDANQGSPPWQKRFVKSFLSGRGDADLLTAARLVQSIADIGVRQTIRSDVIRQLTGSLEVNSPYAHVIQAFLILGEEGLTALRENLADRAAWVNIYTVPEACTLDRRPQSEYEVPWRRVARSIYILGELQDFWLAEQLRECLPQIVSLHLLYHIGEALLALAHLPNRTAKQRTVLRECGQLLQNSQVTNPVTEAYACAVIRECGGTRHHATRLAERLAAFLAEQADTGRPDFRAGFWHRAHGSMAIAEIALPEICVHVLTELFQVEEVANYGQYCWGNYTRVHSSILKAIGRSCSIRKGDHKRWRPLIEMVFKSKRIARNGWPCNHLETILLRWFSQPEDVDWLRQWSRSELLGGPRIREVLSNVLWACE
jgi:hypothetical protein